MTAKAVPRRPVQPTRIRVVARQRQVPDESVERFLDRLHVHPDLSITIVPMGDVGQALPALHALEGRLPLKYHVPVPLPHYAFDEARNQYRATEFITRVRDAVDGRALAVTHVDIFEHPKDFVFGLAETQGQGAVISTHRLHHPARKIFWERVRKEAVHEIGHLIGLHHCHSSRCVMYFSTSIANTDAKGEWFCAKCASGLATMHLPEPEATVAGAAKRT